MSNFSFVFDSNRTRSLARLSLVALTSLGSLACERTIAASDEGLEIVSLGQRESAPPGRARGSVTVRGLHDGVLRVVSTSSDAGSRTLRLAPGLYSVTAATELGADDFDANVPPRLQGVPALVRVEPRVMTVVSVRFDAHDAPVFASGWAGASGAVEYQGVAGSVSERAELCRPTIGGCDEPISTEPAPVHGAVERPAPARRVLDRNPR